MLMRGNIHFAPPSLEADIITVSPAIWRDRPIAKRNIRYTLARKVYSVLPFLNVGRPYSMSFLKQLFYASKFFSERTWHADD